jgi:hypothetical protein
VWVGSRGISGRAGTVIARRHGRRIGRCLEDDIAVAVAPLSRGSVVRLVVVVLVVLLLLVLLTLGMMLNIGLRNDGGHPGPFRAVIIHGLVRFREGWRHWIGRHGGSSGACGRMRHGGAFAVGLGTAIGGGLAGATAGDVGPGVLAKSV